MIDAGHAKLMARYNQWQNASLYNAAGSLTDAARKADRGAFFKSIHGTLCHILWADQIWMSRLSDWDKTSVAQSGSAQLFETWEALSEARTTADRRLVDWTDALGPDGLHGTLSWYSGALKREAAAPRWVCVTHLFNHQTHHRGQVHAMLTAAGARPEDTDLFMMPEALAAATGRVS